MTIPSQVTYMSCYDIFRHMLLSLDASLDDSIAPSDALSDFVDNEVQVPDFPCDMPCEHDTTMDPHVQGIHLSLMGVSLVAGALARSISATLVTPLELVRTRLQASHARSSFSSVFSPLMREVQMEGVGVLWRGLGATLWRDVPFSALYFTGYELGKVLLTGAGFGENKASSFWTEFSSSFVVGAGSGCIAAVATHPFDVVKTRLQAEAGRAAHGSSVISAVSSIMHRDGVRGLFRGLSPRLAKVAPSCGIMIGSFEVVTRLLAMRRLHRE